jgi:hypothetical protein
VTVPLKIRRSSSYTRPIALGAALLVWLVLLMGGAGSARAFTWYEDTHFQIDDAPPNGVYVNIYAQPSEQIHTDLYAGLCGGSASCAMAFLRDHADGFFPDSYFGETAQYHWQSALDPSEEGDFAEAIANAQQTDNGGWRCINITMRGPYMTTTGIFFYDYNWTWRPIDDSNCQWGELFTLG